MKTRRPLGLVEKARRFFCRTRKDVVTQTELLDHLSKITPFSHESVRGTIIGNARGRKLFGQPSFERDWLVCIASKGKKKRFVRRGTETPDDRIADVDYDTPNKIKARCRGLKYLPIRCLKVITLAANEGYCVAEILKRRPGVEITNIEQDPKVLVKWQAKGIPTHDFLGTLSEFIRGPEFAANQYALANFDLMGYLARELATDMAVINRLGNIKVVVLTVQGIRKFRAASSWKTTMLAKYGHLDDPTRACLVDIMDRYTLIDDWFYNRDPSVNSKSMRMFVFRRHT